MPNFNHVVIVGHLTRDPVLRYLPSQTPITEFAVAVNRRWFGPDGQKKEEVGFFDITAFGKQAEVINKHLKKGNPLLISGRLSFQSWTNKDGKKRNRVFITLENFQFLSGPRPGETAASADAAQDTPPRDGETNF